MVGIHVFDSNWTHNAHILADLAVNVDIDGTADLAAMADLMG